MKPQPIRILLVDDNMLIRQSLLQVLGLHSDIEVVGQASDGLEAIELTRQLQSHVILMDIDMPRMNGIDATRAICSEFPDIRVIGFSSAEATEMETLMLRAGAACYLSKSEPCDQLIFAIREAVKKNLTVVRKELVPETGL
jgi:DNA-binding NarL/FixJ family response regulator